MLIHPSSAETATRAERPLRPKGATGEMPRAPAAEQPLDLPEGAQLLQGLRLPRVASSA